MSDLRDEIEALLKGYRCQHTQDDDGNGSKLVDVFTPLDHVDIRSGKEEIHLLADMLAYELRHSKVFQAARPEERTTGPTPRVTALANEHGSQPFAVRYSELLVLSQALERELAAKSGWVEHWQEEAMKLAASSPQRTLGNAQAIHGKSIAFPVKLRRDDEDDPSIEWLEDANGDRLDPYTVMLALNAFAQRTTS